MVKDLATDRQSKATKQSFNINEFRQKLYIPPTIVEWGHTPTLAGGGFLHVRNHARTRRQMPRRLARLLSVVRPFAAFDRGLGISRMGVCRRKRKRR